MICLLLQLLVYSTQSFVRSTDERRMRLMNYCYAVCLLLNLLVPLTSGKSDGVCISPGGRFPPFSNEGKPPRRVNRGPKDLTLCRVFRKKTCCDVAQTHPALLSIRRLAVTGEASQECLLLWELLECSICDPQVGTQPGPPLICASLCDRVHKACSDAYFSVDAKTQVCMHDIQALGYTGFIWVAGMNELKKRKGV